MCGIFGYFCRSYVNMQKVLKLLRILETHQYKSERHPVGGHGAGVCFLNDSGELTVYKIGKEGKISPVIALSKIEEVATAKSTIVLGHVRRASKNFMDTIKYAQAAQPYKVKCLGISEIVSVHNGYVRNYMDIRRKLPKEHSFQSEAIKLIDSEVIPHLFEEKLRKYHDEIEARKKTLENIEGNNAIAILSATRNDRVFLHILHKGQSRGMHIWKNDHGEVIFCSRPKPLQQIFRTFLKKNNFKKILSISYQEPKETQQTYRIVFL